MLQVCLPFHHSTRSVLVGLEPTRQLRLSFIKSKVCCNDPKTMATLSRLELDLPGRQPSVIPIYHRAIYLKIGADELTTLIKYSSTNELSTHYLVDPKGVEPLTSPCKGDVFPLALRARYLLQYSVLAYNT